MALEESELKLFMETVNMFRIHRLYEEEPKNVAFFDNTNHANREENSSVFIKEEEKTLFKDSKKGSLYLKPAVHSCDNCEYKTTTKEYLRIHRRSIHDGIKYPCNKCDYKATQSSSLWQHNKSVHEGIRYPCDQCDYKANRPARLNSHIRETHEGIKHSCDKCDHEATTRLRLNLHIKGVHEGVS